MLMMLLFLCVYFQAAAIQSAAACRALRRSCCPRAGAWWETPRGTPAATRAMRTWRMVMIALHSLDHHHYPSPPPPGVRPSLGLAVVPRRLLRPFFPFCGPNLCSISRHASPTPHPCLSSGLVPPPPKKENSNLIPPLVWVLQRITPIHFFNFCCPVTPLLFTALSIL